MASLAVRYGGTALVGALLAAAALAACSSLDAGDSVPPRADASGPSDGARADGEIGFADAGAPLIEANAIVLVHAAAFPAFRICFDGALTDQPQPTRDLLPESNLVGTDVGAAVRLPPRSEQLGRAFVIAESYLRARYPVFGGQGPTCQDLLNEFGTQEHFIEVGQVTENVSRGVHALVLGGCQPALADPIASKERCGGDWTAAAGNLKLTTLSLMAYARSGDARLSVQLVQLSPALQRAAQGRALGLAFGPIEAGAPSPFVEGAVPFGVAVPNPPATLDYAAADLASYGASGVFVTLGGAVNDAGMPIFPADGGADASVRQVMVAQSLADIQKRSSPRSLPADWFSAAASYVLLSVGDTDPRVSDGGVDDDPRRALHLLAIPLATPDAGDPDAAP